MGIAPPGNESRQNTSTGHQCLFSKQLLIELSCDGREGKLELKVVRDPTSSPNPLYGPHVIHVYTPLNLKCTYVHVLSHAIKLLFVFVYSCQGNKEAAPG